MLLRFAKGARLHWVALACAMVAAAVVSVRAVEPAPAAPAAPAAAPAAEEEDEETAGRRKFAEGVASAPDWVKEVVAAFRTGDSEKARKLVDAGLAREPKQRFARFLDAMLKFREVNAADEAELPDDPKEREAAAKAKTAAAEKASLAFAASARAFNKDFPDLRGQEKVLVMQGLLVETGILAKSGKLDEAAAAAKELFATGFDQLEIFKHDDFDKLRENPKFKEVYAAKLEQVKKEAAIEAKRLIAENKPFAYDFAYSTPEGKKYTLKDFAGKVVIVDVWATWCGPCKAEIPHFIDLAKRYDEKGLRIVGLNVEGDEPDADAKTIAAFVKENGINYPCLVADAAATEKVPNFEGFPTTLFFDRSGKQRVKLVGARPLHELEAIVAELLAEPAPSE